MRERRHKIPILGIKGEVFLWLWKVLRGYKDILLIFGHKFNNIKIYKSFNKDNLHQSLFKKK